MTKHLPDNIRELYAEHVANQLSYKEMWHLIYEQFLGEFESMDDEEIKREVEQNAPELLEETV